MQMCGNTPLDGPHVRSRTAPTQRCYYVRGSMTKEARRRRASISSRLNFELLARRRRRRRRWRRLLLLTLELLARLLGPLLQLVLQLLLLLLEFFGIGRRPIVGLGEVLQRNHEADGLAGAVDALDDQALPSLQLADQLPARLVVGHAAVIKADAIAAGHGLALVDDYPGAGLQRHAQRQGDAKHLLGIVLRLDQDGGHDRHARLDPAVLAGEADLLGVGLLALQAELGPR